MSKRRFELGPVVMSKQGEVSEKRVEMACHERVPFCIVLTCGVQGAACSVAGHVAPRYVLYCGEQGVRCDVSPCIGIRWASIATEWLELRCGEAKKRDLRCYAML